MDFHNGSDNEVYEDFCDYSEQNLFPMNMTKKKNEFRYQVDYESNDQSMISTDGPHQYVELKKEKVVDEDYNFTCFPLDVVVQSQQQEQWSPSHDDSCFQFIPTPEKQPIAQGSKKISKISREPVYMLPGESKNIPKNYVRSFKSFIIKNFPELCQNDQDVRKFLNLKPEKACKQSLEKALKSSVMKQIGRMFFGQKCWSYEFLQENKVDLEPYFRFNSLWI